MLADGGQASIILHDTLSKLSPVIQILEGFNQRHKNQHRLSRWWAQFDMLRRQVRRLELDVNNRLDELERQEAAATRRMAKKRKKALLGTSTGREEDSQDAVAADEFGPPVLTRAAHIRENLVPRAFLAFTQLTTEKQFAHLGLVILAALSQVDAALQAITRGARDQGGGPALEKIAQLPTANTPRPAILSMGSDDKDVGVAVPRDEATARRASEQIRTKVPIVAEDGESTARMPSQMPGLDEASVSARRKTSKKSAKRKEDEFDNIFGSLETTKPRKRKKTTNKSDEFDDLFRSLI